MVWEILDGRNCEEIHSIWMFLFLFFFFKMVTRRCGVDLLGESQVRPSFWIGRSKGRGRMTFELRSGVDG